MKAQMTLERKQAYAEVLEILKILGSNYSQKVPNKLKEYFKNNAEANYEFKITPNTNITEAITNPITINLLGMLRYNYWCNTEEEKQALLKKFAENDKIKEEELREKYNPDNIFKKQKEDEIDKMQNIEENGIAVITEVKWYMKFIKFIKRIFKKN